MIKIQSARCSLAIPVSHPPATAVESAPVESFPKSLSSEPSSHGLEPSVVRYKVPERIYKKQS